MDGLFIPVHEASRSTTDDLASGDVFCPETDLTSVETSTTLKYIKLKYFITHFDPLTTTVFDQTTKTRCLATTIRVTCEFDVIMDYTYIPRTNLANQRIC